MLDIKTEPSDDSTSNMSHEDVEPEVIIKEEVDPLSEEIDADVETATQSVQSQQLNMFPNRNQFFLICGKPQGNGNVQGVQPENGKPVEGFHNKNQLLFICGKPKVPVNNEIILPKPDDTSLMPEARGECRWSHKSSRMLIDLYEKYKPEIGSIRLRSMKQMWQIIAEELSEEFKMNISSSNTENRWRVLERNYKKVTSKDSSGRKKKFFEYFDDMNRVFSRQKEYNFMPTLDSDSTHLPTSSSMIEAEEETTSQETAPPISVQETVHETKEENTEESKEQKAHKSVSHIKKPGRKFRNILEKMRRGRLTLREERLRIGLESLTVMKERNELIRERNEIMKQRNEIMKEANHILKKTKCNSCNCNNSNKTNCR